MSKEIDKALNTESEHSYVQKFNAHKDVPIKKDAGVDERDKQINKGDYND